MDKETPYYFPVTDAAAKIDTEIGNDQA